MFQYLKIFFYKESTKSFLEDNNFSWNKGRELKMQKKKHTDKKIERLKKYIMKELSVNHLEKFSGVD